MFFFFVAELKHAGKYMVRAVNSGGEAQSIADIAVFEPTPDTMVEVVKTVVFEDVRKHETLVSISSNFLFTSLFFSNKFTVVVFPAYVGFDSRSKFSHSYLGGTCSFTTPPQNSRTAHNFRYENFDFHESIRTDYIKRYAGIQVSNFF